MAWDLQYLDQVKATVRPELLGWKHRRSRAARRALL